ncbi:2-C-methyl-D-erythritol 4-phosphate cytidylyltransferase [Leucobacter sp. gxy201]|uniref:2-C-methyl-D-erythritol 4-phosphate cytidylyltransferase n=1 Tax=Leucobacter sp. gxy201 TaxID=2957200 RepID=UPI003DA09319
MVNSPLENELHPTGARPHARGALGVVIVAAGRGERLGLDVPKSFVQLHGRRLLEFGVATVTSLPHAGHLVIVVPEGRAAETLALVDQVLPPTSAWEATVAVGGRERHESVRFGLDALPDSVETVLVHDAARPFASAELFERVLAEVLRTGDAVIPAIPVVDTLKRIDGDGVVHETVDRAPLAAVQTPQGFVREQLAAAHATAQLQGGAGLLPTDDADLVQRAGGTVRTVAGEQRAHKLTTRADLAVLEALYAQGVAEALELR